MNEDIKKLWELIKNAKKILVTTHNAPDPDAWTSLSIAIIALERYLNKKDIKVNVIGVAKTPLTKEYEKLNGTSLISPQDEVDLRGIDLIIMTDAHELERCLPKYINLEQKAALVGIDHHELVIDAVRKLAVNFNNFRSSAAEEVFRVFRDLIGKDFANDEEVVLLAQKGIIADTGRFLYSNTSSETYELMSELVKVKGLDMENYMKELSTIPAGSIKALQVYLQSFIKDGDMAYMAISAKETIEGGLSIEERDEAGLFLTNNIIKNIAEVDWGFIARESLDTPGRWKISFRANNGTREVVHIAKELNGGGHKYAAGAEVIADTKGEAIKKILEAIKKTESIS